VIGVAILMQALLIFTAIAGSINTTARVKLKKMR